MGKEKCLGKAVREGGMGREKVVVRGGVWEVCEGGGGWEG